jgi:enoyl-[acyl-carrier protein] reductase III
MLPGSREMFAGRNNKSLIGDRELTAEDIANAVLYLCAPMSDLVQGSTITIDGGAGIHP